MVDYRLQQTTSYVPTFFFESHSGIGSKALTLFASLLSWKLEFEKLLTTWRGIPRLTFAKFSRWLLLQIHLCVAFIMVPSFSVLMSETTCWKQVTSASMHITNAHNTRTICKSLDGNICPNFTCSVNYCLNYTWKKSMICQVATHWLSALNKTRILWGE